MRKSLISFLILTGIFIQVGYAQQSDSSLGWDLTYSSVLKKNNVAPSQWIWKWLKFGYGESDARDQSPAQKWISEWRGEPIISSILIEYPAFHAAEHTTEWFVRTENKAFYWRIVEDRAEPKIEKKYFTVQAYDDLFKEVSSWRQAILRKPEDLPPGMSPDEINFQTGYFGFLSSYKKGESRQMLLTIEDFVICNGKKCTPESHELKPGRVLNALVNLPGDPRCWEKEYKLKSETELSAMTPHQLIDELIKSSPARYASLEQMHNYEGSIEMKIRQAGIEALTVLTEYLNDYEPQSDSECDESLFSVAQRVAFDIDQLTLRLRGTKVGQQTIDALGRAIERMEKIKSKEKTSHYIYFDLKLLKGINSFDEAIQDTFRVKKKIKISESEMLEFSNFLTARNPTYPSWSGKELFKDYSQINEAGNPAQVYVLKQPERFYAEFAEFRKKRL